MIHTTRQPDSKFVAIHYDITDVCYFMETFYFSSLLDLHEKLQFSTNWETVVSTAAKHLEDNQTRDIILQTQNYSIDGQTRWAIVWSDESVLPNDLVQKNAVLWKVNDIISTEKLVTDEQLGLHLALILHRFDDFDNGLTGALMYELWGRLDNMRMLISTARCAKPYNQNVTMELLGLTYIYGVDEIPNLPPNLGSIKQIRHHIKDNPIPRTVQ